MRMNYDDLIDTLYDACDVFNQYMSPEKQQDRDYLQKLLALNFDVRKNGIKGLGDIEEIIFEDDVRISFEDLVTEISRLSQTSRFRVVTEIMIDTKKGLLENGIDGLKPSNNVQKENAQDDNFLEI